MKGLTEWLSMGGYALYVWSSYGLLMSVFLLNVLWAHLQKKRVITALKAWFKTA